MQCSHRRQLYASPAVSVAEETPPAYSVPRVLNVAPVGWCLPADTCGVRGRHPLWPLLSNAVAQSRHAAAGCA
jgi:hypothetical protein